MIPIPPSAYAALAVGALILGLGAAVKVQTNRLDDCKTAHAAFVAQVETTGREAEKNARAQEAADKKTKERVDAEAKRLRADNARLAGELRNARAGSRYVPAAAPGAANPDRACFSRERLERAIQQLDERVSGLIAQGDDARVGLDSAKRWASER